MSNISVSKLRQRAFPAYVQDVLIHIGNTVQQSNGSKLDENKSKLLPLVSEFVLHTTGSASAQGRTLTAIQELQLVNLLCGQFNKWYDGSNRVRGYRVFLVLFGNLSIEQLTDKPAGGYKLVLSSTANNGKILPLLTQLISLAVSLQATSVLQYSALCFMSSKGAMDLKCVEYVCEEMVNSFCHLLDIGPASTNGSSGQGTRFGNLDTLVMQSEPFTCLFTTVITCHLYSMKNIMKEEASWPPFQQLLYVFNMWLRENCGLCFTNIWPIIQSQSSCMDEVQVVGSGGEPSGMSVTPLPGLMQWCLILPHVVSARTSGCLETILKSVSQLHLHILQAMCSYPDLNLPDDLLQESKVTSSLGKSGSCSMEEEGEVDKPYYLNWVDLMSLIELVKSVADQYATTSGKELVDSTWERLVQLLHVANATKALKHSEDHLLRAKLLLPQAFRDLLEFEIP